MIRSRVLFPLWLGFLLLPACGAKEGDACKGAVFTCSSEKEALECRDSKWRTLPCRGPAGCDESGDTIICDMANNGDGDACAASAEGKGLCTADAKAVLECRMGTLVQTRTCGTCTQDGARVLCKP